MHTYEQLLATVNVIGVHNDQVQKLTEKNTSLEEDRSTMKRKMDDQARSLSTMESEVGVNVSDMEYN